MEVRQNNKAGEMYILEELEHYETRMNKDRPSHKADFKQLAIEIVSFCLVVGITIALVWRLYC